jgi:hypothetical protein
VKEMPLVQSGRVTLLRGDDKYSPIMLEARKTQAEWLDAVNPKPPKKVLEAHLATIQKERDDWFARRKEELAVAAERAESHQPGTQPITV